LLNSPLEEPWIENLESKLRRPYEGRCECYIEINQASNALNDARQIVNKCKDAQALILQAKCYLLIDEFDLAKIDITDAIKIAENRWDLHQARELRKTVDERLTRQIVSSQIIINGNVVASNVIVGNKNTIQNLRSL